MLGRGWSYKPNLRICGSKQQKNTGSPINRDVCRLVIDLVESLRLIRVSPETRQ